MPTDWFSRITHLAQSAGGRLVVRSALNPLLWLCGTVCPTCWAAAFVLRADPVAGRVVVALSVVPVVTTCGVAVYFAVRKPERLQSEEFQLRQQTLGLLREKGRRRPPDPALLAAIIKPPDGSARDNGGK